MENLSTLISQLEPKIIILAIHKKPLGWFITYIPLDYISTVPYLKDIQDHYKEKGYHLSVEDSLKPGEYEGQPPLDEHHQMLSIEITPL